MINTQEEYLGQGLSQRTEAQMFAESVVQETKHNCFWYSAILSYFKYWGKKQLYLRGCNTLAADISQQFHSVSQISCRSIPFLFFASSPLHRSPSNPQSAPAAPPPHPITPPLPHKKRRHMDSKRKAVQTKWLILLRKTGVGSQERLSFPGWQGKIKYGEP